MNGQETSCSYVLFAAGFSAFLAFPSFAFAGSTAPPQGGLVGGLLQPVASTVTTVQPALNSTVGAVKTTVPPAIHNVKLTTGLISPTSINGNVVSATTQTVNTHTGKMTSVDLIGDGLTQIAVDKNNAHLLGKRPAGAAPSSVSLTPHQTEKILDNVVNMKGMSEAKVVNVRNGVIVLGKPSLTPPKVVAPQKAADNADTTPEKKAVADVSVETSSTTLIEKIEKSLSGLFDDGHSIIDKRRAYDREESHILLGK